MKFILLPSKLRLIFYLSFVLLCGAVLCQGCAQQNDELALYRNLLSATEQLKTKGKIGLISKEAYQMAESLDAAHPASYFDAAIEYMSKSRFNDASFLFYVGRLRYRYYNSANPKYENGDDGALLASLTATIQESLNIYLKSEINNYIAIVDSAKNYYKRKDYRFYPRSKNSKKYDEQWQGIQKLIDDMKANKTTYTKTWNKEIMEFRSLFKEMEKNSKK